MNSDRTQNRIRNPKTQQRMFWFNFVFASAGLVYLFIRPNFSPGAANLTVFLPAILGVIGMAGCAYHEFRALKQEITALKSGGPDDSTATQGSE